MPAMIARAFYPRLYPSFLLIFLCACLLPYVCRCFFVACACHALILPANSFY